MRRDVATRAELVSVRRHLAGIDRESSRKPECRRCCLPCDRSRSDSAWREVCAGLRCFRRFRYTCRPNRMGLRRRDEIRILQTGRRFFRRWRSRRDRARFRRYASDSSGRLSGWTRCESAHGSLPSVRVSSNELSAAEPSASTCGRRRRLRDAARARCDGVSDARSRGHLEVRRRNEPQRQQDAGDHDGAADQRGRPLVKPRTGRMPLTKSKIPIAAVMMASQSGGMRPLATKTARKKIVAMPRTMNRKLFRFRISGKGSRCGRAGTDCVLRDDPVREPVRTRWGDD